MQANLKQAAMRKLVHQIYPNAEVVFDMSRRCTRTLATAYYHRNLIRFNRPLFEFNLASCLRCALHEVAHFMQHEISGYSRHDKQFKEILEMLIEDYGDKGIAAAKKNNNSIACSTYTVDHDPGLD